jgi:RNA polymerase sigma-70 factor (ECF subfamily)
MSAGLARITDSCMTVSPIDALLDRLAAGDPAALGEAFDRYSGLVNGLALRILKDTAEADEVIQEVFLQVWRQATRFDRARGSAEAWICTITRTRALDRLRRRTSRREDSAEALEGSGDAPRTVEALAVRQALSTLPADQRTALELAYYEGLTQSEIAERLGAPLGTVKTRIRTAMIRLRDVLAPAP